jgi:hypothetical protein
MPGQRTAVGRRARGSRLSRLTGISVILVLAVGGVIAYLVTFHPVGGHSAPPLSTKVVSNQTIGLVAQDSQPGSSQLLQLRVPGGQLRFSLVTQAEQQAGSGQWTADQMGDNTYIFIFVPAGTCLTAASPARLALRHCDLQPNQRWRRTGPAALADNHDFHQYANLSARSCLTVAGQQPGPVWGASLSACSPVASTSQLLAFYFASA